jgi:hypothetical protein
VNLYDLSLVVDLADGVPVHVQPVSDVCHHAAHYSRPMAGITTPIGLLSVFWWRLVINSGAGYRVVSVFIRSIDGRFDAPDVRDRPPTLTPLRM